MEILDRDQYTLAKRLKIWWSYLLTTLKVHRAFKKTTRQYKPPFSRRIHYWSKEVRLLLCYSHVLDAIAPEIWERVRKMERRQFGSLFSDFNSAFKEAAHIELAQRGLTLKDAPCNAMLAAYLCVRNAPERDSDRIPAEWQPADNSIRRARRQAGSSRGSILDHSYENARLVSQHFDEHTFNRCRFDGADLSNASFRNATFIDCSFRHVLMVNTRLVEAQFLRCDLQDVDLSGAMLEDMRLWYPNRCQDLRADAFTRLKLPLLEECELSYELAHRNYATYRQMFSGPSTKHIASELAYREQHCRAHSYPLGWQRFRQFVYFLSMGYGRKPQRFGLVMLMVILIYALVYFKWQLVSGPYPGGLSFLESLYFSVLTATTFGFGAIGPGGNPVAQIVISSEIAVGLVCWAVLTALLVRRLL